MMLLGDNGEDLVVEVPTGVTISLDSGKEIGKVKKVYMCMSRVMIVGLDFFLLNFPAL